MTETYSKFCLIFALFCVTACAENPPPSESPKRSKAEQIAHAAVRAHGGDVADSAKISFRLRDRVYTATRAGGIFSYTSEHSDSSGVIRRSLTNEGFTQTINGVPVPLSAKDSLAGAEAVNSVVYFTLLPAFLKDPAVYIHEDGTDTLDGKAYHRLKVTFDPVGGGVDHDDVFLYWIDRETSKMDYLAYSFTVNGGGSRFRKAYNTRRINGIVFQDYENYKGPAPDSLRHISDLYRAGRLKLLSKVEVTEIAVSR